MRDDCFDLVVLPNGRTANKLNVKKVFGTGYGSVLFFNNNCRYRFCKGARNTKKSKNIIGYEPIFKILTNENRNVLMLRQNDVDNRQSTFENVRGCIEDLGLSSYFLITKSPLCIQYKKTGQQIIFRGMNNPTSLNSITFAKGFLTDVYVEESYELESYEDFVKIDGSLRGIMPKGVHQQITCCFNAWNKGHWIYEMFFKEQTGYEENYYVLSTVDEINGKHKLKDDGSSIRAMAKNGDDYLTLVSMSKNGDTKAQEILDNAFLVNDVSELKDKSKYIKLKHKIVYGLEDNFEELDKPDCTHTTYVNPNFVGRYGKGLCLHTSTFKINEFRDKENYDVAMYTMREIYPDKYKVEALGMWGTSAGATYHCFDEEKSCINLEQALNDYRYYSFAIGIDTGLSNGEGKKRIVKKNEDVLKRVRSATTVSLIGITTLTYNKDGTIRNNKLIALDEFFHSNDKAYSDLNTDGSAEYKTPVELASKILQTIENWVYFYQDKVISPGSYIDVYVDCADVGFRQVLDMEKQRFRVGRFMRVMASTKLSIQSRVDFTNELMAYGDFKVVKERCPNLLREIRNSMIGEKGEAREDIDDHELNAFEYAWANIRGDIETWKSFKER